MITQAHYQYLLFLRNTFERASGSAGGGSAARELAEAMCRESRALRRVLDLEVGFHSGNVFHNARFGASCGSSWRR